MVDANTSGRFPLTSLFISFSFFPILRPSSEHDLSVGIRRLAHHENHGLRPRLAVLEFQVVVNQKVGQNHLDLVAGEEATGAGVLAGAKVHVGVRNARELPAVRVVVASLAHAEKAEGIKGLRVGEVPFVLADAALRREQFGARWQICAV